MAKFRCGVCDIEKKIEEGRPYYISDEDVLCTECAEDCLGPMFQKALENEGAYPPPWGEVTLDVAQFEDILGEEFVGKYREQEKLYAIPLKKRRYCKHAKSGGSGECGYFLLPRPELPPNNRNFVCEVCGGQSCRVCELPLTEFKDGVPVHDCSGKPRQDENVDLSSLKRGVDYQLCPNTECGLKVELNGGCNHMVCGQKFCKTNFCYICGVRADGSSGHWDKGMPCPRYNQPNAPHAQWDREDQPPAPTAAISTAHLANNLIPDATETAAANPERPAPNAPTRPYEAWPNVGVFTNYLPTHESLILIKHLYLMHHLPHYLSQNVPWLRIPSDEWEDDALDDETYQSFIGFVVDADLDPASLRPVQSVREWRAFFVRPFMDSFVDLTGDGRLDEAVESRLRLLGRIEEAGELGRWIFEREDAPVLPWSEWGWF